ncbi:MAG: hypothetical protein ABGY41_01540, partial [Candidatus Poribacteria bacterium]
MSTLATLMIVCGLHTDEARAVEPGVGEPEAGSWTHTERLLGAWSDAVDVAFLGDGRQVALVESWGRVTVWDITMGRQTASLPTAVMRRTSLEISSAGTRFAVANRFSIEVWDTNPRRRYPSPSVR